MTIAIPESWPRPLALVTALISEDGAARAADLARAMSLPEWRSFADLVIKRHRVAPLIAPRLAGLDVPVDVRDRIARDVRINAFSTLKQIAVTRDLSERFSRLGFEPVVLKGWPLGERLYGAPGNRHSRDLDILVPRDRIDACCAELVGLGYRSDQRRFRILGCAALYDEFKEIEFTHPDADLVLELHWGINHFHGWPDPLRRPGAIIRRETSAGPVLCACDEANVIYLSVHGALHLWSRMKWLADIDRLARLRGPEALEADFAAAEAIGARSTVALALRLSARLFGSPLPPAIAGANPALERHETWMLEAMSRRDTAPQMLRNKIWSRLMPARLADELPQILGVLRYDTLRRVRLGLAGLTARPRRP